MCHNCNFCAGQRAKGRAQRALSKKSSRLRAKMLSKPYMVNFCLFFLIYSYLIIFPSSTIFLPFPFTFFHLLFATCSLPLALCPLPSALSATPACRSPQTNRTPKLLLSLPVQALPALHNIEGFCGRCVFGVLWQNRRWGPIHKSTARPLS